MLTIPATIPATTADQALRDCQAAADEAYTSVCRASKAHTAPSAARALARARRASEKAYAEKLAEYVALGVLRG